MNHQQSQSTYPVTLVFNSVEGFLYAVQQRSIGEIGCATLKRINPTEGGMMQRHTSFLLLTARDHTRDEVLACYDNQLWTPIEDWKRQQVRAEMVQQEMEKRLDALLTMHVVDAAYLVHPDVCMCFATLELPASSGDEALSERL